MCGMFVVRSLFRFGVVVPRLEQLSQAVVMYLLPYACIPNSLHKRLSGSLMLDLLLALGFQGF